MSMNKKYLGAAALTAALAFAPLQGGCATGVMVNRDLGKDRFATENSCPDARIALTHLEVMPEDILMTAPPPPEVAADPGRLAVWNRSTARALAAYDDFTVVDGAGCGAHTTYFCWTVSVDEQGNRQSACNPVDLNNPNAKLEDYPVKPEARLSMQQQLRQQAARAKP